MNLSPTKLIWMDGRLVPWQDAQVHVLTPSLHYGWGVYEGIRAYATSRGPAVFRLREHLARLRDSAHIYLMELAYSEDELVEAVLDLLRVNGLEEGYIRPLLYLGYGTMGVSPEVSNTRLSIAAWPWGSYLGEEAERRGARLTVSSWVRSSNHGVPPLAKATGAYVNSALAKSAAQRDGYDDALFLTSNGHIAEASAANVFVIREDVLSTPPISDGLLDGITRHSIITLARDMGLSVMERSIPRSEIYIADEAFLAGTAAEIVAVAEVDHRRLKSRGQGPITCQIREQFQAVVHGCRPEYDRWLTYA